MSDERPCSLIVVEDERPVAKAIARVLERRGHSVELVYDCAEARTVEGDFDGGVFDIDLPDGNGLDIAREFIGGGRILAAVFFSASENEDVKLAASNLGSFVHKKHGIHELTKAIGESVEQAMRAAAVVGAEGQEVEGNRISRSEIRRKHPR